MAKKELPLILERVVELFVVGDAPPVFKEVEWIGDVGIPDRTRRVYPMLRLASAQPGDRAAVGAVDLNGEELVTIHPNGPRGVELCDDVAGELERAIGRIVGRHSIAAAT